MRMVIAAPTLLYGNETWIPTHKGLNKIQFEGIKFLVRFKNCSILDKELGTESLTNKIMEHR